MTPRLLVLLLAGIAAPASAAVYKYVDADGNVTFSDRYRPGAVKFLDSGTGPVASPGGKKRAGIATPAGFPRVDGRTQDRRDDIRRGLLLDERRNEENALAGVRTQLIDAKPRPAAELARLRESLRLHEKNIEMLDKELARLK